MWTIIKDKEKSKGYYRELMDFVDEAYRTKEVFPLKKDLYKAFELTPVENVKVVIMGQDPYHQQGQAHGLAFSSLKKERPASLRNILQELESDLGIQYQGNNLTGWAQEGVLLLNRVLTVEKGKANSHRQKGWEEFTDAVITYLSKHKKNLVFILWGKEAQRLIPLIQGDHLILTAPHPSPLSAYRGFFNSKPFSQTNHYLKTKGIKEIDWSR